jgi:hypothetical protein
MSTTAASAAEAPDEGADAVVLGGEDGLGCGGGAGSGSGGSGSASGSGGAGSGLGTAAGVFSGVAVVVGPVGVAVGRVGVGVGDAVGRWTPRDAEAGSRSRTSWASAEGSSTGSICTVTSSLPPGARKALAVR